jgi:hypothetical protein
MYHRRVTTNEKVTVATPRHHTPPPLRRRGAPRRSSAVEALCTIDEPARVSIAGRVIELIRDEREPLRRAAVRAPHLAALTIHSDGYSVV